MSDLWGLHTAAEEDFPGYTFHLVDLPYGVRYAARYYHFTDNPNFVVDPDYAPLAEHADHRSPGLWVAPEEHQDSWRFNRPYRVEFDGPDDLADDTEYQDNPFYDGEGLREVFVPADRLHLLKQRGVSRLASTDGIRYAHVVEADVAEDLHRVATNVDPDVFQHGGCIEYAHALKQRFPHLQLGTLATPGDPDDWQHLYMHDGTHAYDSAGVHPMPYLGAGGDLEPGHEADFDWYDEPDEELLDQAHRHIEQHGIGPRTAHRTATSNDYGFLNDEVVHISTKELMGYMLDNLGPLADPGYSSYPNLVEDIKQNGIKNPVWLSTNGRDVVIQDGKHRVNTADRLGLSHVPVVITRRKKSSDFAKPIGQELGLHLRPHRTAMPLPMPEGITFHHHPTNDTIPTDPFPATRPPHEQVPRFSAPAVEARHNGETVGYLEWDPPLHATVVNGIQYGDHPPEVSMIKVHPDYRRHGIATALFDFARQHQGDLEHSDSRTGLGNLWVDYEQSRIAARPAFGSQPYDHDKFLPEIHRIRDEIVAHGDTNTAGGPRCGATSEEIAEMLRSHGVAATENCGAFRLPESNPSPHGHKQPEHSWVELPDGYILDATADQFGYEPVRLLHPDHPDHARYLYEDGDDVYGDPENPRLLGSRTAAGEHWDALHAQHRADLDALNGYLRDGIHHGLDMTADSIEYHPEAHRIEHTPRWAAEALALNTSAGFHRRIQARALQYEHVLSKAAKHGPLAEISGRPLHQLVEDHRNKLRIELQHGYKMAVPDLSQVSRLVDPAEVRVIETVNPRYFHGTGGRTTEAHNAYKVNCQRSVLALDARHRGFNVEARPNFRDPGNSQSDEQFNDQDIAEWWHDADGLPAAWQDAEDVFGHLPADARRWDAMTDHIASWGPGARGAVAVTRRRPAGVMRHIVHARVNPSGLVNFEDPQDPHGAGLDDGGYTGGSPATHWRTHTAYDLPIYSTSEREDGDSLYADPGAQIRHRNKRHSPLRFLRLDDKELHPSTARLMVDRGSAGPNPIPPPQNV